MRLAGKVAVITGGASGIGAAVSELLAREGASVAVTDVDGIVRRFRSRRRCCVRVAAAVRIG